MFEEQLKAARQARRQDTIKIAAVAIFIILLSGIILALSSSCCGSNNKKVVAVEGVTQQIPSIAPANTQLATDDTARGIYMQLVNSYKNELEPVLERIDLAHWQPDKEKQLASLRDAALTAFTAADYATASEKMQSAIELAEELIKQGKKQFEQAMTVARQAYETDRYDQAKQYIDKAIMLNVASAPARALAEKIGALATILPLLKQSQVARTENNAEKELAVIKQILAIAPERVAEQARKQELVAAINLQNFQSHLDQSYAAIEQQDVAAAMRHINRAKQIYPNRAEIRYVNKALQDMKKQQRITGYSNKALAAMRKDSWHDAKQYLVLAMAEQPNDKALQGLLDKTSNIISIMQQIERQLADPYRLADKAVKAYANKLLEDARPYRQASPQLTSKADELADLIDKMSKKISVMVLSDNKTNVLVRGVGIVGVTHATTINLHPGKYKFEGKRTGYKSKLINVVIPYDKSSMQLTIICDEPI